MRRPILHPFVLLVCAGLVLVGGARAEEPLEGAFGDMGRATVDETTPDEAGTGVVVGHVVDGQTGLPISGATVIVIWPVPEDGSEAPQEVRVTEFDGGYEFRNVPEGRYTLTFVKSGYRASTVTDFEVKAGQDNAADFPLPPMPAAMPGGEEVMELDAFVVEASTVGELMNTLELRMDSDKLLDIMSAEDLSRYAASDVAEALKRVAGVNIVEGQFAIIRGLEDRYSSTLYNGAPVPSPDPDKQSVQLDLFASDIVGNLQVAKTFAEDLPSNSSGGSIDIVTHEYPDEVTIAFSGGSGWNQNASDSFLEHVSGSPVGKYADPGDTIESEYGGSVAGRHQLLGREVRFKGVLNREIDYETKEGFQQAREPNQKSRQNRIGDLSLGLLNQSRGLFDLSESTRERQDTGFLAAGVDIDSEGKHELDGSFFWTQKREETVELRENGYYPNVDYAPILAKARQQGVLQIGSEFSGLTTLGSPLADFRTEGTAEDGQVFYAPIQEWRTFEVERELTLFQLNGAHEIGLLGEPLHVDWAANHAKTTQTETAFGAIVFFEPDDPQAQIPDSIPVPAAQLGPGQYAANNRITFNTNDVDETQYFGRIDLEYERPLLDFLSATLKAGVWYEDAQRDVVARNLLTPRKKGDAGEDFAILGASPAEVGGHVAGDIGLDDPGSATVISRSTNDSSREIAALHVGGKASFWERLDLLGGVRLEDLRIESKNEPFTGGFNELDGSPITFPTRYLMWDRYDNPNNVFESAAKFPPDPSTVFNDQLLGISVPIDPVTGFVDLPTVADLLPLVNGEIDERKLLPSLSASLRPPLWQGAPGELTLRGAYSQTVARPSFREMGFYVTTRPGSDDLVVGNPQLDLSEVESWDARAEYVFGDLGDLVAGSFFVKTIQDPIEAIIIQDPSNFSASSSVREFQTFFNNRNTADLRGFEVEARIHLDLLGLAGPASPWLELFSIGGNYTRIDAEVARSEAEVRRASAFFGRFRGAPDEVFPFSGLNGKRRLFNQPEWIANADISFEHPDWGTKVTLAFFAISDVLDAVGSIGTGPGGEVQSFTLDRYIDAFDQLDLVASQRFALPRELGAITLKASVKNLTDSRRAVIYDPVQTAGTFEERAYRIGRDYSFALKYEFTF